MSGWALLIVTSFVDGKELPAMVHCIPQCLAKELLSCQRKMMGRKIAANHFSLQQALFHFAGLFGADNWHSYHNELDKKLLR